MSALYAKNVIFALLEDGGTGLAELLGLKPNKGPTKAKLSKETRDLAKQMGKLTSRNNNPVSHLSISDICRLTKGHPGTVVEVIIHPTDTTESPALFFIHLEDGRCKFWLSHNYRKKNPRLEQFIVGATFADLDAMARDNALLVMLIGHGVLSVAR
jgi:hypothetical protein